MDEPGVQYLVNLDAGGTVDVELTPGDHSVRWINAQDVADAKKGENTRSGMGLSAPSRGDDWPVYRSRISCDFDDRRGLRFET